MKDGKLHRVFSYDEKKEESILQVVEALDFLRRQAEKEDLEEIAVLVKSTFEICYTTYYLLKRQELAAILDRGAPV